VTSDGIRCSKGTPIIKKPNPSLFIKGGTTKEKNKSLDAEQMHIWPWVPAGLDARSDHAGWLPAVIYCSALLCSALLSFQYSKRIETRSTEECKMSACEDVECELKALFEVCDSVKLNT
jgi:hypothetical protein